jgi:hypothetical protein
MIEYIPHWYTGIIQPRCVICGRKVFASYEAALSACEKINIRKHGKRMHVMLGAACGYFHVTTNKKLQYKPSPMPYILPHHNWIVVDKDGLVVRASTSIDEAKQQYDILECAAFQQSAYYRGPYRLLGLMNWTSLTTTETPTLIERTSCR